MPWKGCYNYYLFTSCGFKLCLELSLIVYVNNYYHYLMVNFFYTVSKPSDMSPNHLVQHLKDNLFPEGRSPVVVNCCEQVFQVLSSVFSNTELTKVSD